ncbi:MAG: LacI family DNA-binding transcriptional regulator [Lachnospiraceae bacterium]
MNIYDISQKSGVSIATVSRVINSKPGVSEKTRQKVLAVMDEIAYTPNVFARNLGGTQSIMTIGILCKDVVDPYLSTAVTTVERELRLRGYDSFLSCTGDSLEGRKKNLQMLLSKRVDAVILIGSHFINDNVDYIKQVAMTIPVILINGHIEATNIYSILCDDHAATIATTDYFIKKGYRNILYLYDTLTYSGIQKLTGYKQALSQNAIPYNEELTLQVSGSLSEMATMLGDYISTAPTFDAVIAAHDMLAIAMLKACTKCNLSIPEDIELISYNNSMLATCSTPELSTVDSRVEALCMTAVTTLFGVLEGKNFPEKTIISGSIVFRDTTK